MTSLKFFELVSTMRDKQKEYFRTRDKNALVASKRLERQVDDEIARVNEIMHQLEQKEQHNEKER